MPTFGNSSTAWLEAIEQPGRARAPKEQQQRSNCRMRMAMACRAAHPESGFSVPFRTAKDKGPGETAKPLIFLPCLVGEIGLEPTTPTMSRWGKLAQRSARVIDSPAAERRHSSTAADARLNQRRTSCGSLGRLLVLATMRIRV
jgi:hypothetical protein